MAEIAFRNVVKTYGNLTALAGASFTIADGRFFCLFGPPLSGRSTILRLMLGLETPDEGEILIDGRRVNEISPAGRDIAMVFQTLTLFPDLTARDNVAFALVERRASRDLIAQRVAEVAEKLRNSYILHKLPGQLSGGERQHVPIARALVRQPGAYLMDDPISALDARLREEARGGIKRIHNELRGTLVSVTHYQEEALSVADPMAVLEYEHIRQIGCPLEICELPRNGYVARLSGSPTINPLEPGAAARLFGPKTASASSATHRIGVRPEDLRVGPAAETGADSADVFEVESLGGQTVVTLDAGETRLRALMRGQPDVRPNSRVGLSSDISKLHFFAKDGAALARATRAQGGHV